MSITQKNSVLSSLFIDFDNIYLCLMNQDSRAAKTFAMQPEKWFAWLNEYLEQTTGLRRRITVRQCYMNPKSFGDYRPYFLQCGFEVVDCPALTASGKTSADIRIAIDMLELADYKVPYEEFILLSADADFTPVMLKLRKRDYGTIVLAIGNSSPIYRASCSTVVSQDVFIAEALIGSDLKLGTAPIARVDTPLDKGDSVPRYEMDVSITQEAIDAVSREVVDFVHAASAPVAMATLAAIFRKAKPELGQDWAGYGSFKRFLGKLQLTGLMLSTVTPGYLYDPKVHTPPSETDAFDMALEFAQRYPNLVDTAKKVSRITDTPYLMPEQYRCIFAAMAEEINAHGYNHITQVSKVVRDKCKEANLPVGRVHVDFILASIAYSGHHFGVETERPDILAQFFVKNTMNLCEKSLIELSDEEKDCIKHWLIGSTESGK